MKNPSDPLGGGTLDRRQSLARRALFRAATAGDDLVRLVRPSKVESYGPFVVVRYRGRRFAFYDPDRRGDYDGVWGAGVYDWLPVRDTGVVDVGATVGDSSVRFACRGARAVLGFEGDAESLSQMGYNVWTNGLSERIWTAGGMHDLGEGEWFSERWGGRAVLKMDCEGAEYAILRSSRVEWIRRFSHIVAEYHYGIGEIKSILERAGFRVRYSGPYEARRFGMRMGIVRAVRSGE